MIVACTSCSVQYTVPDAKVRGRKVQVTCKHCRTPFVIDGSEKEPESLRVPDLHSMMDSGPSSDATRVMARPDFSVHDEPTVVGQIPAAALEAERRYAQRTVPPPANGAADSDRAPASSQRAALPGNERVLPPYSSEPTLLIPTPLAAQSSAPPPPRLETTSLVADDLEPLHQPSNKRRTYVILALATVLVVAVVIALTTR